MLLVLGVSGIGFYWYLVYRYFVYWYLILLVFGVGLIGIWSIGVWSYWYLVSLVFGRLVFFLTGIWFHSRLLLLILGLNWQRATNRINKTRHNKYRTNMPTGTKIDA